MAKILSSSVTIRIFSPGTSTLATLAASMPVGTWAKVEVNNQNSILTDNDGAGSGSHLHYSNSMNYIPQSDRIQLVGADHGTYNGMGIFEYDIASNQFFAVTQPSRGSDVGGAGPGHGYDHATVNPFTGDAYQLVYGIPGDLPAYKFKVKKRDFGAFTFASTLPATMESQAINITFGSCWWSGPFSGAGNQGFLLVYNVGNANGSATDGVLSGYDPKSNTWFYSKVGASPGYYVAGGSTYHNIAEYSPRHNCAVFGGGGSGANRLWRLNEDGTVNTTPFLVPAGKAVGVQSGNLVCDPVTGNFLLFSNFELWELNPTGAGTWTKLTGARNPPTELGSPGPGQVDGIMSCALPKYGVTAYIKQSVAGGGVFYIYKHA